MSELPCKTKFIYAVVLHWNNYVDAKECIYSLLKCSQLDEIIVVDNASNDGSLEKLKKEFAKKPSIVFIINKENFGFAKGINVGVNQILKTKINARYIILLNQDTVVDYKFVEECYKVMENKPNAGMVGPRIYYYNNPNKIWHGGGYFNLLKSGVINPEKNKYEWECDKIIKRVNFLTGCVLFVKREVFDKVELFAEDYFLYEEDVDFSLKVHKAGFEMYYVPTAKVWHKISNIAQDRIHPFVMFNLARSKVIFLRRNFPWYYFLYGFVLHLLIYTPFRLCQATKRSHSWKSGWAWFNGSWQGLRQRLNKISTKFITS